MDENYWALFCATGEPLFYLLYRAVREEELALTAWAGAEGDLR